MGSGNNSFSKNMMRLAISAVSLSVATMILTIATVKGFQNGIRDKVVKIHGSYIVDHAANVEGAEPLVISSMHLPVFMQKGSNSKELKNMGVSRAAISASKACIVKGEDDLDGMIAKGMELGDFNFGMGEFVIKSCREPIAGTWVYISQSLSDRLKLDTGDALTLVFFVNDSSGNGRPRAARPIIAGIFETGIEQIDNQVIYTGLDLVQKYTEVKPGFTQIELWESNNGSLNPMEVAKQLDPGILRISDSKQFHRQIYDWLAILNTNVWVILILMAVVAIIAMSTILLILMVEKTSFVGIAQAMGSPISQIQKIFLWQSAIIVFFGVVIGDVIAVALCWIQDNYHYLTLNQDVYFVKYVMVDLEPMSVLWVNIGVVLASVLAALLPVQWIKRMTPSRAIRFQ
jgi:lipoprotein-releasing system permease protein